MSEHRPARGQTQSYLRQLLASRGLRPRQSLGQCFLIDLNLLDILVEQAELDRSDFVLEVGAGTGSLTQRLADQSARVLSIEVDPKLYELAELAVRGFSNVTLIRADVLQHKNALNPVVLDAVRQLAPADSPLRLKLVANLPYSIATPLISLLLLSEFSWDRFVVTIQKEVAERLIAMPSTKDYGSVSVLVQAVAEVSVLRELSASVFWPRPQVSSAIVRIVPDDAKRSRINDLARFHKFVRGVMLHRRKNLRGAIHSWLPGVSKGEIDQFLAANAAEPHARAESLTVDQFIELADAMPAHWNA